MKSSRKKRLDNFILKIILQSLLFTALSAQKNSFMLSMGGGTSTLQGYTIFSAITFERLQNEFTLRFNYNNQTGNLAPALVGHYRYNDRFREFAFLYGRAFRYKDWFFASASLGPGYFKYSDKHYDETKNCLFCSGSPLTTNEIYGWGLASQTEFLFILQKDVGFSINFPVNVNGIKPIGGIVLSMVFGILRSD